MPDKVEDQQTIDVNLDQFLRRSHFRNSWLRTHNMSMYLRRGFRKIPSHMLASPLYQGGRFPFARTLEIANVSVSSSVGFGNGNFKAFYKELRERLKTMAEHFDGIYIENVMDPRFQKFFLKQGFVTLEQDDMGQRCMYLDLNSEV